MNYFKILSLPKLEIINQFPIEAKILAANYQKLFILKNIKSIRPKLHKIVISTELYYNNFEQFFENIAINNTPRQGKYQKTANTKFLNRDITILYKPENGFLPKSKFELHNFDKSRIVNIFNKIGPANISEIEYTIDFLCKGHVNTRNLFILFMKYLYVPYANYVELYGKKDSNFTYYIRNSSRNRTFSIKVYERAGTNKKPKDGFKKSNIDRVRLEITAPREKLKNKGIFKLSDLLEGCNFSEIIKNAIKFKKFKDGCKAYSKEWEYNPNIFSINNKKELFYSFQKEYTEKKLSNPNQYIENAVGFRELNNLIKKAISTFY